MDGAAVRGDAERCVQRAFNLAYRIAGSEADAADAVQKAFLNVWPRLADGEHDFRLHLLGATRGACHERMRTRAIETIPTQIDDASMRLPERQREALALRELEELSYEEIAAIMEVSPHAVAELISRARINLCGELGGTALASAVAPSPECERALPLIAMREDGQLDAASREATWLEAHLAGCGRCMLAVEAMREAHASYRTLAPVAAPAWLLEETMAKAAELTGGDSSDATPRRRRAPRRTALAAGLGALLLLAGIAAALVGDNPPATPADSAASTTPRADLATPKARPNKKKDAARKKRTKTLATAAPVSNPPEVSIGSGASSEPTSGQSHPSEEIAIQPTQQMSASKPKKAAPAPVPASTSQPASEPAPEESAPAAEPPSGPSHGHEPPGKPPDRPPR